MQHRNHAFNIGLNVAGMVLPMLVGALTVPGLLHRLGQERFGILALSWALVGYFGFLDLGIGRALTQHLASAEKAGVSRQEQATLACAARRLLGGFSLFWALLLWLLLPWLTNFVQMSVDLRTQVLAAVPLLALAVPFTMWFACSAGVLEARSRFGAVNSVRIPIGVGNFLLPWFASMLTTDLSWVIGGILGGRLVGAVAMALWARSEFSNPTPHWPTKNITKLLRFGGWMTLSNLVGPLMSYFDRFAIAALATVTAVTYYTVPFDVLSRLPMVPIAVMSVLLPLLAQANQTTHGANDHHPTAKNTVVPLLICWIPGIVLVAWTGPFFLEWWVGAEISKASTPIWRWLAIGVLVNGLAHLPFTMMQSAGRTDVIAKIHLFELLPYGVGLWWALTQYGIVGAAILWSLRVSIDMGLLFFFASQIFPSWRRFFIDVALWGLAGALATIWIATTT